MSNLRRDVVFHSTLGLMAFLLGTGLFLFVSQNVGTVSSVYFQDFYNVAVSMLTLGSVGWVFVQIISFRRQISQGETLLKHYSKALGPPPTEHLDNVLKNVNSWLGAK